MPAPPAAPVVCEEAPWRLTTVAREPLIMEPALAVAPSGQVHVTWTRGGLGLARGLRPGLVHGTLTASSEWTLHELSEQGNASSLAVDSSGGLWVSFHADRSLMLAHRSPDGTWSTSTVEPPPDESTEDVGIASAIALGPNGEVHIAYYVERNGEPDQLRHAVRGESGWTTETVDDDLESADRNPHPHLAIGPDGTSHIVYIGNRQDEEPRLRPLLHASRERGGSWRTQPIADVSSTQNGFENVLALDATGALHVTYHAHGTFDRERGFTELRYAHRPAGGTWRNERWEWPPHVGGDVPIAVDRDGRVHVTYLAVDGEQDRVAHAEGSAPSFRHTTVAEASTFIQRLVVDERGGAHVLFVERGRLQYGYLGPCATRRAGS